MEPALSSYRCRTSGTWCHNNRWFFYRWAETERHHSIHNLMIWSSSQALQLRQQRNAQNIHKLSINSVHFPYLHCSNELLLTLIVHWRTFRTEYNFKWAISTTCIFCLAVTKVNYTSQLAAIRPNEGKKKKKKTSISTNLMTNTLLYDRHRHCVVGETLPFASYECIRVWMLTVAATFALSLDLNAFKILLPNRTNARRKRISLLFECMIDFILNKTFFFIIYS